MWTWTLFLSFIVAYQSLTSAKEDFIQKTRKIIGVGLNYKEFLAQTNFTDIDNPIVFLKPPSSLVQASKNESNNFVEIPNVFSDIHFEAELGIVIGKPGKNIPQERAFDHIDGYFLALDMTAFDFLNEARAKRIPWALGKSFDRATPVSRFLSRHEVKNPQDVQIWAKVNGETKQDGSTKNMIFSIPKLIAYISRYMILERNDLILTGTPAGAGSVNDGDVIECGLANIVKMKFSVRKE